MLKLVEKNLGVGQLESTSNVFPGIRYTIFRYQGFTPSGMPIPGLFRIEGSIDIGTVTKPNFPVGSDFTLRRGSDRPLRVTVADEKGRILVEGHGPKQCQCC